MFSSPFESFRQFFFCILVMAAFFAAATPAFSGETDNDSVRKAVWAGRFYPAAPDKLRSTINELMTRARKLEGRSAGHNHRGRLLRAIIFPHASYQYSGVVAARSALEIEGRKFKTVILMGPDHQAGFGNVALTDRSAFETPLGKVMVSPLAQKLRELSTFRPVPRSDRGEHSLEVVIPFLQYVLDDFSIVPLVVGPCSTENIADAILPLLNDDVLMVVSSDLSHYLPYDEAVDMDRKTIDIIMSLDPHKLKAHENRACGVYSLKILMAIAEKRGWKPELLLYMNSGDTWGGRSRVVGYVSMAFYQEETAGSSR